MKEHGAVIFKGIWLKKNARTGEISGMYRQGQICCCWSGKFVSHNVWEGLRYTAGTLKRRVIRSLEGRSLVGDQLGGWWVQKKQNGARDVRRSGDKLHRK